jgi:hypothetical protein
MTFLPGDVGCRGDHGGEVCELDLLWFPSNSSPELRSQTDASGRCRSAHSHMKSSTKNFREVRKVQRRSMEQEGELRDDCSHQKVGIPPVVVA